MFGVLHPESLIDDVPQDTAITPPPNSLAPMPPAEFATRDALIADAKRWTAQQGYAVVIARSRHNRLWLKCDKGGTYENRRGITPDQRKRKRGESRLQGCPFRIIASLKKDGSWRINCDRPDHNHGPSQDLTTHPTLRRMNEAQLDLVRRKCDEGATPAETKEELERIWPDIKVLTRDVYNARKKYRAMVEEKVLESRTASGEEQPGGLDQAEGQIQSEEINTAVREGSRSVRVTRATRSLRREKTAAAATEGSRAAEVEQSMPHPRSSTLDPRLQGTDSSQSSAIGIHGTVPFITSTDDTAAARSNLLKLPPYTNSYDNDKSGGDSRTSSLQHSAPSPSTAHNSNSTTTTTSSVPSNQTEYLNFATRIEKIEHEQREQRIMLAEILGAVRALK